MKAIYFSKSSFLDISIILCGQKGCAYYWKCAYYEWEQYLETYLFKSIAILSSLPMWIFAEKLDMANLSNRTEAGKFFKCLPNFGHNYNWFYAHAFCRIIIGFLIPLLIVSCSNTSIVIYLFQTMKVRKIFSFSMKISINYLLFRL